MTDESTPRPDGTDDQRNEQEQQEQHEQDEQQEGTVSEVASFKEAGETIFPSDATAGYPLADDEGGAGIQEGSAGPDAPPSNDDRGRREHRPGDDTEH